MSAPAIAVRRPGSIEEFLLALPRQPAEGWLSLVAACAMAVVYGLAVMDSGWIPRNAGAMDHLPWLALFGVTVGFAGAKLGWGRWRTHLIGAAFAGLLLPLVMGGAVIGASGADVGYDPRSLAERIAAATNVVGLVWRDLVVEGRPFTTQYAHFHIVFGAMVWAAGQLAGFNVFGHRRPLDAVVVVGLLLLSNMILTSREQLPLLILFSAAAMLLLIRSHVFDEQVAWTRRRIGDPKAVGQLYMRGGTAFVAIAIAGSLVLTATASSAPLQDLWRDLPSKLVAMSEWFQRIAPPGGPFRNPGAISFGRDAATTGVWNPSDRVAFRAQFQTSELRQAKWRVGTYSHYTLYGWGSGDPQSEPFAPRDTIFARSVNGDAPTQVGRRQLQVRVTPDGYREAIVSPQTLLSVDVATTGWQIGDAGWFTIVEPVGQPTAYNVIAMVPVFQDVLGGITEARLRAAGADYPAEVRQLYTAVPDGALGDQAQALLADILARVDAPPDVDPDNPYDLARTIETYLQDDANFVYDDNVVDLMVGSCDGVSDVECFARIRRGHCVHYAGLMAVLMRVSGIPARIAYGFLPGERDVTGLEIVGGWAMHWWVEVYFPGTGWVEFDPTGGGVGQPQVIPSGSVGPATPRPSVGTLTLPPEFGEGTQPPFTPGDTGPAGGVGPFIAIALILGVGVGALALASLKRAPRWPMQPDHAWGGLARWARRFGLGPRPSQTVYEYAGALGDELPSARVELTTLARAKVEVAYGRRDLGPDRLRRVAVAYQRLRFALVSFAIRRGLRRKKSR